MTNEWMWPWAHLLLSQTTSSGNCDCKEKRRNGIGEPDYIYNYLEGSLASLWHLNKIVNEAFLGRETTHMVFVIVKKKKKKNRKCGLFFCFFFHFSPLQASPISPLLLLPTRALLSLFVCCQKSRHYCEILLILSTFYRLTMTSFKERCSFCSFPFPIPWLTALLERTGNPGEKGWIRGIDRPDSQVVRLAYCSYVYHWYRRWFWIGNVEQIRLVESNATGGVVHQYMVVDDTMRYQQCTY